MPRFGEPLEIIGRADNLSGVQLYEDSTAACFTAGTRTAAGPVAVAVEHLRPGDPVRLAMGGMAPVALVIRQSVTRQPAQPDAPIRLQKDALGPGQRPRSLPTPPPARRIRA